MGGICKSRVCPDAAPISRCDLGAAHYHLRRALAWRPLSTSGGEYYLNHTLCTYLTLRENRRAAHITPENRQQRRVLYINAVPCALSPLRRRTPTRPHPQTPDETGTQERSTDHGRSTSTGAERREIGRRARVRRRRACHAAAAAAATPGQVMSDTQGRRLREPARTRGVDRSRGT